MIRNALVKHLEDLDRLDLDQLLEERHRRLAGFGDYKEQYELPQFPVTLFVAV